jgi:hypothetical protein
MFLNPALAVAPLATKPSTTAAEKIAPVAANPAELHLQSLQLVDHGLEDL